MKKVVCSTLGVISVLMIFFGFPIMINNIGKNQTLMFLFMGIFVLGCIGMTICALVIMLTKNKDK